MGVLRRRAVNATLEAELLLVATAWRDDIRAAARFTAVKRDDGNGVFFLSPVVGSMYTLPASGAPHLYTPTTEAWRKRN